jgi:hypothetical protein
MLRTAFKLALRQTEGLMTSVLTLMGLTISAPDHSTISRRTAILPAIQPAWAPHGPLHVLIDSTGLQVYGAGQWLEAKHGAKSRRTWRKLHLAVDAASGMIVAQTLTDQDVDDPSQVGPLLDQIDDPIGQITADGAYDGAPTYQTIAAHRDGIEVVIPPRSTAVPSGEPGPPTQRDRHLAMIADQGRLAWQTATDYGQRSLVETTMGRYKLLIGPRLRARGFAAQQTEAAIGVAVLNRMLAAGSRPQPAGHRMTPRGMGSARSFSATGTNAFGISVSFVVVLYAEAATNGGRIAVSPPRQLPRRHRTARRLSGLAGVILAAVGCSSAWLSTGCGFRGVHIMT